MEPGLTGTAGSHKEQDMARVAFIGLGNMGGGMAANLAKAGHDVTDDLRRPRDLALFPGLLEFLGCRFLGLLAARAVLRHRLTPP